MSALGNESGVPAVMNVAPTGAAGNGNCGGWGGDWASWILLFLIFGMFGFGGFGGGWGGGMFGGMGGGYPVESILQRSLDTQTIIGKLDGVTQGLCDGFYAQSNAINGLGMNIMQGFSQVELAETQRQAALMQQLYQMGYNQQDCCCRTQRSIDDVRFTIAQEECATRNLMQTNTRDIIENQNANSRAILDYLCQDKISTLQNENQALRLAASQSSQNAVLMAAMDANKAEILRRTGAECPTPAYIVQPPQPVSFATNCNGQATFNNGWGNCGNTCGTC